MKPCFDCELFRAAFCAGGIVYCSTSQKFKSQIQRNRNYKIVFPVLTVLSGYSLYRAYNIQTQDELEK